MKYKNVCGLNVGIHETFSWNKTRPFVYVLSTAAFMP